MPKVSLCVDPFLCFYYIFCLLSNTLLLLHLYLSELPVPGSIDGETRLDAVSTSEVEEDSRDENSQQEKMNMNHDQDGVHVETETNTCCHEIISGYVPMDEKGYFSDKYLSERPLAFRHCAECKNHFGKAKKVSAKEPAHVCRNALLANHPCMQAYCHHCYDRKAKQEISD
jgi:hypothetical protein